MDIAIATSEPFARTLRHGLSPQRITDAAEIRRFQVMAEQYRLACQQRPFVNRALLAMNIGHAVLNIPAKSRRKAHVEARQRIIAFTYVIGGGKHSYCLIGRVFDLHHATVMHAVHKYEAAIREILR